MKFLILLVNSDKNITLTLHNVKAKRVLMDKKNIPFKTLNKTTQIPILWKKGDPKVILIQL
jgi:oligosaccharide 4-alpha-D-glucosyltransferase